MPAVTRPTIFPAFPETLSIPKDYAAAELLLNETVPTDQQPNIPTALLTKLRELAPDLFLVRNARPTYHADSRLTTDPTISIVYKGTVCVVYVPSGWVFLNTDGMAHDRFKDLFTKLLGESATPLEGGWYIKTYKVDGNGRRTGVALTTTVYKDHMAVHPATGQAMADPYMPRE